MSRDDAGIRRLCRQFSTPGGIPSHVSVQTPGSIHEGGELGYALVHAAGAAFDHPNLLVACVIGDGEAETGPLSGSWKLPAFLNAGRDGAVLPILHLNGTKIAGPTVLRAQRATRTSRRTSRPGLGRRSSSRGTTRGRCFPALYAALAGAHDAICDLSGRRGSRPARRARWPAIVLRTPKGWTGPHIVDGVPGRGHAPGAPGSAVGACRTNPAHLRSSRSGCGPTRRTNCSTPNGAAGAGARAASRPQGDKRMRSTPYANGGRLRADLPSLPTWRSTRSPVETPGTALARDNTGRSGSCCATSTPRPRPDGGGLPAVLPGRDVEQPAAARCSR